MNFVKHMRHTEFLQIEQSASGYRMIIRYVKGIRVVDFTNQVFSTRLFIDVRSKDVAISPNGAWIAYAQNYGVLVANVETKEIKSYSVNRPVDRITVSDSGEAYATGTPFVDGTVYRAADQVFELKLDPLYGRKFLSFTDALRIGDDTHYGTPGNLISSTSQVLGIFGEFTITADGKINAGTRNLDLAEPLSATYNCGRFIVVRTATQYIAIMKTTFDRHVLSSTDPVVATVPDRLAIGPTLRAYTGEQLSVVQGEGTLTISGPAAWLDKFKYLELNGVPFDVEFVEGAATIQTDIFSTDVKQIYLAPISFSEDSDRLLASSALFQIFRSLPVADTYHYISRHPLLDASVLLFSPAAVANPTTYEWGYDSTMMFKFETVGRSVSVSTYHEAVYADTGPGPQTVSGGDETLGFYGEVGTADFINTAALSELVGISAGTERTPNPNWLKFSHNGKILFIAKQTIRYAVSWNLLNSIGLVSGKEVTINGKVYKVRLITGSASPTQQTVSGGEWNDLIYRVSEFDPTGTYWARYTDAELGVTSGNGVYTWCQEPYYTDAVYRGLNGVEKLGTVDANYNNVAIGWRPVLELIG